MLLALLSVVSTCFFVRAVFGPRSLLAWSAYAVSTALMLYTHYYGVLTLLSHEFVWATLFAKDLFQKPDAALARRLPSWLGFHLALAVLYGPWIPVALGKFLGFGSASGGTSLLTVIRETVIVFFTGHSEAAYNAVPGDSGFVEDQARAMLFGTAIAVIALAGLFLRPAWRSSQDANSWSPRLLIAAYALVPVIGVWVLSLGTRDFTGRYLIGASPAYFLLIGNTALSVVSASFVAKGMRMVGAALVAVIVVFISLHSLINYYTVERYRRDDWRAAARYLSARQLSEDAVIVNGAYATLVFNYYYTGTARVLGLPEAHPPDAEQTYRKIAELVDDHPRIWLVLWQDYFSDPQGLVRNYLASCYRSAQVEHFHGKIRSMSFVRLADWNGCGPVVPP
jgi:uncharacterized membrane protein